MYSNRYIFIYSSIMVIAVAAVFSSATSLLKPLQEKNIRTEKMMNILQSVRLEVVKSKADAMYAQYIIREEAINSRGEIVSVYENGQLTTGDVRPFDIDLKVELHKLGRLRSGRSSEEPLFPVYICRKNNENYYIIPVLGRGLWGPVWGNIAFESDLNTIYGVTFDHKSETPGLGAEINTKSFQDQFPGKQIFDPTGEFASIAVVKGGVQTMPPARRIHGVDAISGGTITSDGVSEMLKDCLSNYLLYIKNHI
jgi:Na+-transporting NADH:ubiquinone oxidoreductase subunit C